MSEAALPAPRARAAGIVLRLASDERLCRLAARGDRDAFAAIYSRHHQALFRYCRSILTNPEDAADALQAAMTKAMLGLEGRKQEVALKPWLYRIAHNEAISLARRRRPQADLEAAAELADSGAAEAPERRARLRQLLADLAELPDRQRGELVMRELGGLSYAEIATALDVTDAAAKQGVYEARTALQEFAEGRAMACDAIRRTLSESDRRRLRGRRVRAHLRDCAPCRDFEESLRTRPADLAAFAPPLPALAAAGLLESILGSGGGGGTGGGLLAALGGGGATAGASLVVKGAAVAAATIGLGAATAGLTVVAGDGHERAGDDSRSAGISRSEQGPQSGQTQPAVRAIAAETRARTAAGGRDTGTARSGRPDDLPARPGDVAGKPGADVPPQLPGGRPDGTGRPSETTRPETPRGRPEATPAPGRERPATTGEPPAGAPRPPVPAPTAPAPDAHAPAGTPPASTPQPPGGDRISAPEVDSPVASVPPPRSESGARP
ncbi:MAG TPA: sigma-70 family RNA polymerase sigma factor [Thermoleophilaceae bacterium]|nr:sigma-70 family RNA polymerase sigma factor [Thermoleophilaceae bacterium]